MTATPRATLFALAAASLSFANSAFAQDAPAAEPAAKPAAEAPEKPAAKADAPKPRSETATLGAGCFWSTEAVFEHVKGVKSVTSGFAGGNVPRPTYEMVCTGQTGHAEVVQVVFDPNVISYEKLLKVFWSAHDPTTRNSQGDDFGPEGDGQGRLPPAHRAPRLPRPDRHRAGPAEPLLPGRAVSSELFSQQQVQPLQRVLHRAQAP